MQNDFPRAALSPPAYGVLSASRNCCAACATRSSGASRCSGCAASSPTCRAAPSGHLLLHPEGRRRPGRLRDVPQPRRGARLGAARRHAGRGAGAGRRSTSRAGASSSPSKAMRQAGLGPLYERFLRLKEKLEREGLFDAAAEARAAAASRAPIGVLTSLAAAALRDVLTTLARRNPAIPVIVYPVPVQGEGAAERIARDARARQRSAPSATCCCWCAAAARSRTCGSSTRRRWRAPSAPPRIPVVVGVGHETDFTIADFAADRRAPTPTAAAELASPSRAELLGARRRTARAACRAKCAGGSSTRRRRSMRCARRLVHPARAAALVSAAGDASSRRASPSPSRTALHRCQAQLARLQAALASLDPDGGARARLQHHLRTRSGAVLRDASARAARASACTPRLARGELESEVKKSDNPDGPPALQDHHAHRRQPARPAWATARACRRTARASHALGDVDELNSRARPGARRRAAAGSARRAARRCSTTCSTSAAS